MYTHIILLFYSAISVLYTKMQQPQSPYLFIPNFGCISLSDFLFISVLSGLFLHFCFILCSREAVFIFNEKTLQLIVYNLPGIEYPDLKYLIKMLPIDFSIQRASVIGSSLLFLYRENRVLNRVG